MSELQEKKNVRHSIVLIDDDDDIRDAVRDVLLAEGYEVHTATNGKEGLELLRRINPPLLVLLDMSMPVMNGMEFLSVLSNDASLVTIPIHIYSSENLVGVKGARGILKKPATHDTIIKIVNSYRFV